MQPTLPDTKLNLQQVDMLVLFKHPFPEEDYQAVRRLVVQLSAKQVDDEMQRLEAEKGWTQETYEQWGRDYMWKPICGIKPI